MQQLGREPIWTPPKEPAPICLVCGAQLPVHPEGRNLHDQWHKNISDVAIETTRRVRALERSLRELIERLPEGL